MAWLVTWEGTTQEHFLLDRKVVAVLPGQLGVANVRRIIESLYLALATSEEDVVRFGPHPGQNPFRKVGAD